MKYFSLLLLVAAGCTSTTVTTSSWSLKRLSFLQQTQIPAVDIETNGSAHLRGYTNDGGTEALKATIEGAVAGAVKVLAK